MANQVDLNSTASHGPTYFYELVRQSLWLLKSLDDVDSIRVVLHPIKINYTPLMLFYEFKSSNPGKLAQLMRKNINILLKSILRLNIVPTGQKEWINDSLYGKVYSGQATSIQTQFGTIEFSSAIKKVNLNFIERIKLDLRVLRLLGRLKTRGQINPQLLLHWQYKNVQIGDLVASAALRQCTAAGGSLILCDNLFKNLAISIAISDYFETYLCSTHNSRSFVSVPEPTYLSAVYLRLGLALGISCLESESHTGIYYLTPPFKSRISPRIINNTGNKFLTPSQIKDVENYMDSRFLAGKEHPLWYMINGTNDEASNAIYNSDNLEVRINKTSLYVVVFLHSFDDGQYFFGLDGFDDLYQWTTVTLDLLISNKYISNIFVKPHPNSSYEKFAGDQVGNERLMSRYYSHPKVTWLCASTSIRKLSEIQYIIGITHHGSVAEELVYLNVPTIGCGSASPWMQNYSFLQSWKTPNEYKEILNRIDKSSFAKSSESDRQSLYLYIYRSRLNLKPTHATSAWMICDRLVNREIPVISSENFRRAENQLANMSEYSDLFKSFIEELVSSLA